jgi:hypothetical protein
VNPVSNPLLTVARTASVLLAGMARGPELHDVLVLKGGTALRKFTFRDYRFSWGRKGTLDSRDLGIL